MVRTVPLRKIAKNLSEWRWFVLERDNHMCQSCGATEKVIAHHVKSKSYYPRLKLRVDNGIALCQHCHNIKKEYALPLFRTGYVPCNVVLHTPLIGKIRREADKLGLSFSAFIRVALTQYLEDKNKKEKSDGNAGDRN